MDQPLHDFSWRRELPWLLPVMLIAVLMRLPIVPNAWTLLNADNANGPFMAKYIWQGRAFPLYSFGQDYLGALEAYLQAPLYGLLGADARGQTITEIWLTCVILLPLYRLAHRFGARPGALAGTLLVAVGTPHLLTLTTVVAAGYLSSLLLTTLLMLLMLACLAHPTPARLFGLGLLSGLALWNNIQAAPYVAVALCALAFRSHLWRLLVARRLPAALRQARHPLLLAGVLAIIPVGLLLTYLALLGHPLVLGPFSLTHPARSLPRIGFTGAGGLLIAEWILCDRPRRRSRVRRALVLASGLALGVTPIVAHHALERTTGTGGAFSIRPAQLIHNYGETRDRVREVLAGEPADWLPRPWARVHGRALSAERWLWAGLLAAVLLRGLAWIAAAIVRRQAMPPPLVLICVPGLGLLVLCVLKGHVEHRYVLSLIIPATATLSWAFGALWRRARPVAIVVGLMMLAQHLLGDVQLTHHWLPRAHPWIDVGGQTPDRGDVYQALALLHREQLLHGRGNYWAALKLTYFSDEAVIVYVDHDHWRNYDRLPHHARTVRRKTARVVKIFDKTQHFMPGLRDRFYAQEGGHVMARWRRGRYVIYRIR